MKKYNVFKVLSVAILITILASFIIPSTTFDGYGGVTKGNISPIGFIDTFANSITSFSVFLNTFIFILSIGIFYGILHKTGKYESVINNTAVKFQNKKTKFVIISILIFGIMSAILGNVYPMLILVPAFIEILMKLGYDKKTSITSTIGAIILGSTGSLFTNYANQILSTTVTDNILLKIIIIILSMGSLILFSILFSKKPEKTNLTKKVEKNSVHISVIFDIILLFIIIGMVPWKSYFGFEGFTKFHEAITDFKVFEISPFKALVTSTMAAFGEWTLYDISVIILIFSFILSLINKIKLENLFETLASSIKKSLPYALIVVIANIVLVNVYASGLFYTIIVSASKLSDKLFSGTLISALSAFVYPDYMYASQFSLSTVAQVAVDKKFLIVLSAVFQAIYSLMLLISPTSILILLGLKYTEVSYKEWIKYIIKYFLVMFALIYLILIIFASKFMNIVSLILLGIIIILTIVLFVVKNNKKDNIKTNKKEVKTNSEETKKDDVNKKSTSQKKQAKKNKSK